MGTSEMWFGLMPERGIIYATFIVRQLQEKYLGKKKNLYFVIIDLEKAFDRVPRGLARWAMRKLHVDEQLIETIMAMYEFNNCAVRINNTVGNICNVKNGVLQGSALNPLLFIMVLEALSRKFRNGLSQKKLYADDFVITVGSFVELE